MPDALDDADAIAFERSHLLWIVGKQPDRVEAELTQHLGGRQVAALVGVEAELLVGVYRVETGILELVGAQLVDKTDATAFLGEIKQHAAAGLCDRRDRTA